MFIAEFERQADDKLQEDLLKFASMRVNWMREIGVVTEPNLAGHLVANALTDTVLGVRFWDPKNCDLRYHAKRVIQCETKDMIARSARYRHERLDNAVDDDTGIEARAAGELHRETIAERVERIDLVSHVADSLTELARANNDHIVLRVLDAYRKGIFGRSEVAAHAGISRKEYDRARERIKTLLRRLPEPLVTEATEVLGGPR